MKIVLHLLSHEFKLELRNKTVLGSVLLYVVSTIKKFNDIHLFNTLFWIITVFTSLNAALKSFANESSNKQLYIYTLVPPQALIFSKIIYNAILISFITGLNLLLFGFLFDFQFYEAMNFGMYATSALLGCLGLSTILTLVSAIASKTNNNVGLIAVLAFPLMLPLLLTTIEFSLLAIKGFDWTFANKYLMLLGGINVMIIALSYLLFPYLWRE